MCKNISYKKQLLDDMVKSFQLALALCDKENIIRYKARYEDLIYELSLETALNITQKEYHRLFIEIYPALLGVLGCDSRNIITALILQQKEHIENFNTIFSMLNQNYPRITDIKNSDLMGKSALELIALYEKEKFITHSHYVSRNLSSLGSKTDDIDVAYHLLSKIRDDREDLKKDIYANIIYLKANISYKNLFDNEFMEYYTDKEYMDIIEDIKYKIAKKTYLSNKTLSDEIIKSTDLKHKYLFKTFIAYENNNVNDITSTLDELYQLLQSCQMSYDDYDHLLLKIGHIIVDKYPFIAHDILSKLHTLWGDTLDLEVDIAVSFFKNDVDKGLEYINSIDVEHFQYYAIAELVKQYNDENTLKKLIVLVGNFELDAIRYMAFYTLNKKIKIPFEKLLEVSAKILPYDKNLIIDY